MRPHLVHAVACSALLALAPVRAQAVQDQTEAVKEVARTAAAGDKVGHLAAYRNLAAVVATDPAQQNLVGLIVQTDLQRNIARAAFAIGSEDACAALDQGGAYLGKARAIMDRGEEAVDPELLHILEGQLAGDRRRMRCAPADIGTPDASLAGHYYLSGVMETGSELLLKPDGQFKWYISYGAVDQVAEGRWGRTGQTVILAIDAPPADAPLFRADEVFPWDADAERMLRESRRTELEEIVAERCPWNIAPTTTLWRYDLDNQRPADEAQILRASEARRAAEAARDEAGRMIAAGSVASATVDERAAASAAMNAWYDAHTVMAQAHHDAGLPEPDIGSPAVPPECTLPADDSDSDIPQSQWHRGLAVMVGDPASEMRLSGVEATFVFDDGHRETRITRRRGLAFAPVRQGVAVQQIVLAVSEPVVRTETLAITPLTEGIQAVIADTRQIAEPPFQIMRLDIQDNDLIPQNMPRGRYSRN